MVFTDKLFEAARPIWAAQLEHPFVKGIGDGSLDERLFTNWVLQDYRYLKEFARIFAWAVAKADHLESMGWYAAALNLTLNTEMDLHRQYAARFGISPEDLEAAPMWPTTRAYLPAEIAWLIVGPVMRQEPSDRPEMCSDIPPEKTCRSPG